MDDQTKITLTYDEAVAETETLLKELEGNQLSIDEVLRKSRRVVALINHCREEIRKVGDEIDNILDELKADSTSAG